MASGSASSLVPSSQVSGNLLCPVLPLSAHFGPYSHYLNLAIQLAVLGPSGTDVLLFVPGPTFPGLLGHIYVVSQPRYPAQVPPSGPLSWPIAEGQDSMKAEGDAVSVESGSSQFQQAPDTLPDLGTAFVEHLSKTVRVVAVVAGAVISALLVLAPEHVKGSDGNSGAQAGLGEVSCLVFLAVGSLGQIVGGQGGGGEAGDEVDAVAEVHVLGEQSDPSPLLRLLKYFASVSAQHFRPPPEISACSECREPFGTLHSQMEVTWFVSSQLAARNPWATWIFHPAISPLFHPSMMRRLLHSSMVIPC